ncbi:hypothetical protein KY290_025170 [Solanum tuberosum]|uniref:Ulp1 protease family, C-terminal catalytic domain containing protein n=1 Tax=Solanum tuberosum TaxID=4113 RepID=A0ABQ7UVY2_SOLTU|nr:hypothetical protein KY290_025170 [Solanum tuberosum]
MKSLEQDFNLDKQMYRLSGMPYPLNVWTYECASSQNPEIVVKEANVIPRICNWRVVVLKPKFETFMSSCFLRDEVATLDLPDIQDAPPPGPSTVAVNPKKVQPKDIVGFENFSISPPEQLVRRSSRVSGTSSPPPSKRRKKVDTPKIKVLKPSQSEQLNVPINQSFSMPVEPPTLVANLSFVQVDKKFEYLEALIKGNHSQLMKYIHREDNQPPKDVAGKCMSCMVEVSDQKCNVEPQTKLQSLDKNIHDTTEASEYKKDDAAEQGPQHLNEVTINEDASDTVQQNTSQFVSDPDSTISSTISSVTQEAIDTLITDIGKLPIPAKPVSAGKEELDDDIRPYFPFENCGITYQAPSNLIDEYMHGVTGGLLKSHANKYYNNQADDNISTQERINLPLSVGCCRIKTEVNTRVDSSLGSRKKVHSGEIKKLTRMLPSYLLDSGFFGKTKRTNCAELDAYKDKESGILLEPQHPFKVEFAQDIMQQKSDSLDCSLYVATCAEFLIDQLVIPPDGFRSYYLRNRYAALLWRYGSDKAYGG